MTELKKVGVFSAAKISAILMAIFGLIGAIIILILGAAIAPVVESLGLVEFGIAAVIIVPIMYGIIGFLLGAVGAFFYNLIAGWIGGIKMEFAK